MSDTGAALQIPDLPSPSENPMRSKMANLNNMRFNSVSPEALEVAERVKRDLGSPFTTRALRAAHEAMLARKGDHTGAGARSAEANERTALERRALEDLEMRSRLASRDLTPEDRAPYLEAIELAEASEETARINVEAAAKAMQSATTVFNKMVLRLFEAHRRGEVFRPRKVIPRKGDPAAALAANLSEQRAKVAEAEPVRNATPPNATYEDQIARQLDDIADPFKLFYTDGMARWTHPERLVDGRTDADGHYRTERDLLPLLVALHRDEIQRRLFERIERDHANDPALRLTAEEKQERLGKLRAELLELQREEAALRVVLAGDSPEVTFRPEMSPLATLGLEVVTPAKPALKKAVTDALAHIGL